jgi:hypothetical protein
MMVQSRRAHEAHEVLMSLQKIILGNVTLVAVLALTLPSCGSDEPKPAAGDDKCGACTEPDTTTDLMNPVVSFKTDLYPSVIRPTCATITCHGAKPGADAASSAPGTYPMAELYLGPPSSDTTTPTDAALMTTIITSLKAASKTAPAVKIVAPGDPGNSFLVAQIYGCQNEHGYTCSVDSKWASFVHCTTSACGDVMPDPLEAAQLSVAQKDTFRRWIAQGAQDN